MGLFRRAPEKRAADEGLRRIATQLRSMTRPSVRVVAEAATGPPPSTGTSRIGGRPDLVRGTEWPTRGGAPLAFLAQFSLADLAPFPAADDLPGAGLLSFFYPATEQPWGALASDAGAFYVRFSPSGSDLVAATFPDDLSETDRFEPCSLKFSAEDTLPMETAAVERLELNDAEQEAYSELCSKIGGLNEMGDIPHRLLGHSQNVQGGMEDECAQMAVGGHRPEEWRLLFQLGSERAARMMWGDMGALYFWIPQVHLEARDFSKVWGIMQCY